MKEKPDDVGVMFNLAVCKLKVVRRMVKGGKNGQCKMLIE